MNRFLRLSLSLLLIFSLLLTVIPVTASPATSGKLDNSNITWSFNTSTGVLTVGGTGKMPYSSSTPEWLRFDDQIKSVVIQSGVTDIGRQAFWSCGLLTAVSIPDTVKSISTDAFYGCDSLKTVVLPDSLTSIAGYAFGGCSSLEYIEIPAGVKKISGKIFLNCHSLKQVKLNEGLEVVGENAFYGVPLTSISIPNSVKVIEKSAFEGCKELNRITLGEGLETIGFRAFCGCDNLKTITFPSSLKYIYDDAFVFSDLSIIVMKSRNCTMGQFGNNVLGPSADVYGYPGSTVQTYVEEHPEYGHVFKPMYFNDVTPGVWYFDAVTYAKENSLFDGVGNGRFAPETTMTRAMMVQVLYNYAGDGEICENSFTDVPDNAWYTNAVAWAAKNEIVNGVGNGRFDPEGKLTREQLASIMHRFMQWREDKLPANDDLALFSDRHTVSGWALSAMQWAVGQGIINGVNQNGGRYLQPQGEASRAQVATILQRYIGQSTEAKMRRLHICAEVRTDQMLTRMAEAFMAEHEYVEITVTCNEYMDLEGFVNDKKLIGNTDLYFSVGEEPKVFLEEKGVIAKDSTPVLLTPYVFAVSSGPGNIEDISDVVDYLKKKEMTINLASAKTPIGAYSRQIFLDLGVSEAMFESFLIDTYDDSRDAAFWASFGSGDCTITREIYAIENYLTVLGAPEGFESGDLLYASHMVDSQQRDLAQEFIDFLLLHGADEMVDSWGFEPIPE